MSAESRQINLTSGPIARGLTKLALPIIGASFLGTVYNITDMIWIGMLGAKAIAGVGVGGMFLWLSTGLSALARMGGQVLVGQKIGAGQTEEAKKYAISAIQIVVVFAILFGFVFTVFTRPMVNIFGIQDEITNGYASVYTKITSGLVIFSFLTFALTGIYTAQGDSKTPLEANFIGLASNMILDPLLIHGVGPFPKLGVAGAAIATVFAQFIVSSVMIVRVFRDKSGKNVLRGARIWEREGADYYKEIVRIGGPASIQSMVYCGISMLLTRMVAGFGPAAIAVQRVGGQVEALSWNTADGFAAAMNTFSAQNFGAGKRKRIRDGYKIALLIAVIWGALVSAVFILFPETLAGIFFYEADVIARSVDFFVILGIGEMFMCVELMTIGALSGLGYTKLCSIISICMTGSRIPLALLLTSSMVGLGLNGIWWALTLTSIAKGFVFTGVFKKVS